VKDRPVTLRASRALRAFRKTIETRLRPGAHQITGHSTYDFLERVVECDAWVAFLRHEATQASQLQIRRQHGIFFPASSTDRQLSIATWNLPNITLGGTPVLRVFRQHLPFDLPSPLARASIGPP